MAAWMRFAGYAASGNACRQRRHRGLEPPISVRDLQNLVKTTYGLRWMRPGRGPKPTYSEAWALHDDCPVGTAKHVAAIVDGKPRDTFDGRLYGGCLYGGIARDLRKAQSIRVPAELEGRTTLTPEFGPSAPIPPPRRRQRPAAYIRVARGPHTATTPPIPVDHHAPRHATPTRVPPGRAGESSRTASRRGRRKPPTPLPPTLFTTIRTPHRIQPWPNPPSSSTPPPPSSS